MKDVEKETDCKLFMGRRGRCIDLGSEGFRARFSMWTVRSISAYGMGYCMTVVCVRITRVTGIYIALIPVHRSRVG